MDKPRVLIVEDDTDLQEILEKHLTRLGCDVELASNGEEALKKLKTDTFTCLLSDIRMPGMDGVQMITKMKEQDIETPVVFMTGYSSYKDEEISHKGGVVLLEKPMNFEKLKELYDRFICALPY
jgi:DNA-binding NtrC family response regulator